MSTPVEPLRLQAVVGEGSAEEAVLNMRTHATARQIVIPLVVKAVAVSALTALTHHLAWLLLLPAWVVLSRVLTWRLGPTLRGMRTTALRPGSLIRVEWREHELVVHRPSGTVHFRYDDMAIADTTAHLTGIWVRDNLGEARRRLLYLPTELVPPDAVTVFRRGAGDGHDPFGAAGMDRVFEVPQGWPRAAYGISTARKTALAVLGVLELALLSVLALVGHWTWLVVAVGVVVAFVLFMRTVPFRAARRRLPPGSVVGVTVRDGRVALALPDKLLDLPESRLRNVTPAGVDIVNFQFKGTNLAQVPVPRQLFPDDEIDRLRQVAGRRPMSSALRLN
jgi:hypothetical protein